MIISLCPIIITKIPRISTPEKKNIHANNVVSTPLPKKPQQINEKKKLYQRQSYKCYNDNVNRFFSEKRLRGGGHLQPGCTFFLDSPMPR
jgi:hypothetical protein